MLGARRNVGRTIRVGTKIADKDILINYSPLSSPQRDPPITLGEEASGTIRSGIPDGNDNRTTTEPSLPNQRKTGPAVLKLVGSAVTSLGSKASMTVRRVRESRGNPLGVRRLYGSVIVAGSSCHSHIWGSQLVGAEGREQIPKTFHVFDRADVLGQSNDLTKIAACLTEAQQLEPPWHRHHYGCRQNHRSSTDGDSGHAAMPCHDGDRHPGATYRKRVPTSSGSRGSCWPGLAKARSTVRLTHAAAVRDHGFLLRARGRSEG